MKCRWSDKNTFPVRINWIFLGLVKCLQKDNNFVECSQGGVACKGSWWGMRDWYGMKLGHISVRSPLTISVLPSGGDSLGQDKCGEPQQPPRTNTRYIGSVSGAAGQLHKNIWSHSHDGTARQSAAPHKFYPLPSVKTVCAHCAALYTVWELLSVVGEIRGYSAATMGWLFKVCPAHPWPSLGPHTATRGNTHTASYSGDRSLWWGHT